MGAGGISSIKDFFGGTVMKRGEEVENEKVGRIFSSQNELQPICTPELVA